MDCKANFEQFWSKYLDKAFKDNERNVWMPFLKEMAETVYVSACNSAYKEGRYSMIRELIESGELEEEYKF